MEAALRQTPSACPACAAAPAAAEAAAMPKGARLLLSLPTIHCAGCIGAVERALSQAQGVRSARVNLTLKRVSVDAEPEVTAAALIERLRRAGYEAHELDPGVLSMTETDRQGRDLLMRVGVAGFAMMNIMILSVAVWAGASDATRDMFHLISALIAIPTVAFAGQPFFRSALGALRAGRLNMDGPIALALVLTVAISLYETLKSGEHAYFEAVLMLTFFLLIGRYLDHRARALARSAAQELAALEVPRAIRLSDGAEQTVPVSQLSVGDLVLVRPGGRVPVDGVVTAGRSEVDRSLLTGETLPVVTTEGAQLSAGEVNLTGPLTVRVTAAGRDSSLHRMADLVAAAESARTRYTTLADRAARAYAPTIPLLSLGAFFVWMWISGGDLRLSVNVAIATLIITCPCALGLAVPAVVTAASGRLFRKGLLIKDGTALERLAEVDTVVFDKTGTLTMGAPVPDNLDAHPEQALGVALALAGASSHPLARALAEALQARGVRPAEISDLREAPGYGVQGTWQGRPVKLGRAGWVGATHAATTGAYLSLGEETRSFIFADALRPGAEEVVQALRAQGKAVWLISGDVTAAVEAMARRLGIENWQAGALPEEKAARIAALQDQGHRVLMVGDGLNDTVALSAAHVSISPASALDAARAASDMVLLGRDIAPIADAVRMARVSTRRIRQNFWQSGLYNAVFVPVALLGLCTPLWAALAMSLSSVSVSLNALRLR
ncbi:heavy metal translocating P-type ATPase [Rhodovulum tesquicola]|uniref:heavy metal translocating P-type ATPase n=1 Tax=Rhodovulum tesquicola TaxID=540254 RepID=UPI0020981C6A|nr:heavy metal translocating P-type ATPase [Rhodovulum tesquicola]MCO8145102.1 heavy metal translocating P-type ATPase [Rhodovulum tesquicola]